MLVTSGLLYRGQTEKVNKSNKEKLDFFEIGCFRRILNLRWQKIIIRITKQETCKCTEKTELDWVCVKKEVN